MAKLEELGKHPSVLVSAPCEPSFSALLALPTIAISYAFRDYEGFKLNRNEEIHYLLKIKLLIWFNLQKKKK